MRIGKERLTYHRLIGFSTTWGLIDEFVSDVAAMIDDSVNISPIS